MLPQESNQWRQTVLMATVFFTAMHLQLKIMPVSLKYAFDEVVKNYLY